MGFFFQGINRIATLDPTQISFNAGVEVAGYEKVNLTDPMPQNQLRVTPTLGVVEIMIDFGAPIGPTDMNRAINCIGISGNIDGTTITVKQGSSTTYSAATTATGFPVTLSTGTGHAPLLMNWADLATQHLFIRFTSAPSTLVLSNMIPGYGWDLGYPLRPEPFKPRARKEPRETEGGYLLPSMPGDPVRRRVHTFQRTQALPATVVYNKERHASNSYKKYLTVWDAWSELRQQDLSGTGYTGLCAAGGTYPIFYHEGSMNGLSPAGRPAQFGFCDLDLDRNRNRNASGLVMTIRDCPPYGSNIFPPV